MDGADRSILATLAYAAASDWPLTLAEVAERLIPSARVGAASAVPSLGDIAGRLDVLARAGTVKARGGLFAHADVSDTAFARRVACEKESVRKWRLMRSRARWLTAVPYIRALFASGSLAQGNTGPDSDWDVFVVAQAGRLYTARLFLVAATWSMGRLRTKHHATAPDRFCFNHYVTTDGLAIGHCSLYTAHGIASLVPVYDPQRMLGQFRAANEWITEYVSATSGGAFIGREVRESGILATARKMLEIMLDTPLGARIEHAARWWQQRRIAREPATSAPGGRVVADERELEFHPRSFEAVALARYNTLLTRAGLGSFAEHDSGLTK